MKSLFFVFFFTNVPFARGQFGGSFGARTGRDGFRNNFGNIGQFYRGLDRELNFRTDTGGDPTQGTGFTSHNL